jgi:hypothetical protein
MAGYAISWRFRERDALAAALGRLPPVALYIRTVRSQPLGDFHGRRTGLQR